MTHSESHCCVPAGYEMDLMGRVTPITEEARAKASRRSSTGSASPAVKMLETRWSKWTNEGVVFRLAPGAAPVPGSHGEWQDVDSVLGDSNSSVTHDQSAIMHSLEMPRRKAPYNGELIHKGVAAPTAPTAPTPVRESSENPFFCFIECF